MKYSFYSLSSKSIGISQRFSKPLFGLLFCLFFSFFFADLNAEGSKDFRNYPGYRMFLDTRNPQQMKVFAKAGEFLNVGASHIGYMAGFIEVYHPDGTLYASFSDPNLGIAVIHNDVEEINGPTGGGSTNGLGYEPGVVQVPPDGEGIWTVVFDFPTYAPGQFSNLLNTASWTRNLHQPQIPRVILAWDVTVSQLAAGNEGGNFIEGRVYSNEYVTLINQNGFKTSPTFYILTKDGFQYEVDFDEADPFRFPITSNSSGFVYHNLNRTYKSIDRDSVIRSDDPDNWVPGEMYYYEPQAEDMNGGVLVNNKVFFNIPNPDMPTSALVTDIYRNNTHVTWLYNQPATLSVVIDDFEIIALNGMNMPCDEDIIQVGIGGNLQFTSTLAGTATLSLDLNFDGDYSDDVDRVMTQLIDAGANTFFWDGRDGQGNLIPATVGFKFNYQIEVRGGEAHIIMEDIENNFGGVTFEWVNNMGNPPEIDFYYDHSAVGGLVSGGGSPGNPQPTKTPFVYINNFGNQKFLDYWLFVPFNGVGTDSVTVDILNDCAPMGPDYDEDGISDITDIDDDNDGVPDLKEYCNPGGGFSCLPGGLDPSLDNDSDGVPNFLDADDTAVSNPCFDSNNDGICDQVASIYDTDGDNVPDHLDSDSDNDGITDLVEAGHGQPDADGNGIIDGGPNDFGGNGLYNPIASDPNDGTATETYVRWDWDNDGVPDHDDLDADNDGINDVKEAGFGDLDADLDGRIDVGSPAVVTQYGLPFSIAPSQTGVPIPLPFDKDLDNIPDWHDLDSDNDSILDVEEGGNPDPDNDGEIGEGTPTVDEDGRATEDINGNPLSTTSDPFDSDMDGVPDFHDLDTDNDGINDVREASRIDPDNNGLPGTGIPNVNSKGIPTSDSNGQIFAPTSNPDDTDTDGVRDYRDLDSDNDGINDVEESGNPDGDDDGIIGTNNPVVNNDGQATVSGNGDPIGTTSDPTDTDGDNTPDFRDLDADDDGISDVIEGGNPDPDNDNVIGSGTPNVNIFGQATEDENGNPLSPTSNPTNTDGGQNPDYQDLDADDDGIPDTDECPDDAPCANGDGDAHPDFQDIDRDNDGINDEDECESSTPCPDTDGDGILDVDDLDTDGDGIPDEDECPDGAPCPDNDMDNIPDWRDFECNPLAPTPIIENITGDGIYCNDDDALITISYEAAYEGLVTFSVTGPNNFDTTATPNPAGSFSFELLNIQNDQEGAYLVQLEGEEGCLGEVDTINIEVIDMANAPDLSVASNDVCAGEDLVISSVNMPANGIIYEWFSDASGSPQLVTTTSDPVLTIPNTDINDSGSYWAIMSFGSCVSPASDTIEIVVSDAANVNVAISAIDQNLCIGETIEIVGNTVMTNGVSYEWYFDDGSGAGNQLVLSTDTSYLRIEDAAAANSGTYTLFAIIDGCTSPPSNMVDVLVSNTLNETPFLMVADDNLCEGQTLNLIGNDPTGGAVTEYEWFFDDGSGPISIGTSTDPSFAVDDFTADNEGDYYMVAKIGDCTSNPSNARNVTVVDISDEEPNISTNTNIYCVGDEFLLTSTVIPGNGILYDWFFDDGSGPQKVATTNQNIWLFSPLTLDNSGVYTVFANDGGCLSQVSNSIMITVTDILNQTPNLTASNNNVCEGETIELNVTAIPGGADSYQWYFDDGNGVELIATTNLPTLFIPNADQADQGIYTCFASMGGCVSQSSNAISLNITNVLAQTPSISTTTSIICEGATIELNSSPISGGSVIYDWFFDDGNGWVPIGTTNSPTLFINDAPLSNSGIYSVVASIGGCTSVPSNSVSVTVTNVLNETPIISVNDDNPCVGGLIELNSSTIGGSDVTYVWYFNDGTGNTVIGTTDVPTLFLNNALPSNTGIYSVTIQIGGCISNFSNSIDVEVTDELGETPVISASQTNLCIGGDLTLNSTVIPGSGAVYEWFFEDGTGTSLVATTTTPILMINNVSMSNSGQYTVVVTLGGCQSNVSNEITVDVTNMMGMTPALAVDDASLCAGEDVTLTVDPINGNNIQYEWYLDSGNGPELIATTSNPSLIIDDATPSDSGVYTVVAVDGDCRSNTSNGRNVNVFGELDVVAQNETSEDSPACPGDLIQLSVEPVQNATYEWFGPGGFTANMPIVNLDPVSVDDIGEYFAIVTVGDCSFVSNNTTIYVSEEISAQDDFLNLAFNEASGDLNILDNDKIDGLTDWMVTIISQPENGTLQESNGTYAYTPDDNYFGQDFFVYEVCDVICPDNCAQATVRLNVSGVSPTEDCFVPNIITPNGDNKNEVFQVPCLENDFPNNRIKIFNRWGDEVYQAQPYENDWRGTFKGQPLPAGTYFYLLWLTESETDCLSGYFTITR